MNKLLIATLLVCLIQAASAEQAKVDVVVVGMISHGPMQPTVNAIKEVVAPYGDNVSLTLIDLNTAEGSAYAQDHGLSAHLNLLINGDYKQNINGKEVEFQWFEGQQWTKADLNVAIQNALNGNQSSPKQPLKIPSSGSQPGGNSSTWVILAAIIAVVVVALVIKAKAGK